MEISVNGVRLFYEAAGAGEPLLLLHGNGEDHHIWDPLAARLSEGFAVYAIDSRNHGQSEMTKDYAYETMAADVYAFIQTLSLGPVWLAGFSDGAILGLLLAMKHPEALRKMALLGPNLRPEDFTAESLLQLRAEYERTGDPLLQLMLTQPRIDLEDVRRISVPALVVAGENDIFRPETFTALAEALPEATLRVLPGQDHESYVAGTDSLYPLLMEFFTGRGTPGGEG